MFSTPPSATGERATPAEPSERFNDSGECPAYWQVPMTWTAMQAALEAVGSSLPLES